jgi:hypothetical protein
MRRIVLSLVLGLPGLAMAFGSNGERLAHVVGCVNCHHQTPKEIINAPPLLVVKAYTFPEFRTLLRTGVTRTGRDLLAQSSIMGIVAKEQFAHMTDAELQDLHTFLRDHWTARQAADEEAKIPLLYRAHMAPPAPAAAPPPSKN